VRYLLAGVGLALALLIAVGAFSVFLYRTSHAEERETASSYEARPNAQAMQATCSQIARTRTYSCVASASMNDPHNPYAEADLRAQQDMAASAYAMALTSLVALLLTGVGVLLLWWTLNATRAAVAAASAANTAFSVHSQRELRAYVGAFDIRVENFLVGRAPRFRYDVVNYGQTPARDVEALMFVIGFDAPETPETFKVRLQPGIAFASKIDLGPHQPAPQVLDAGFTLSRELMDGLGDTGSILCGGLIRYRDVFGVRHWTVFRTYLARQLITPEGKGSLSACRKNNRAN
jgi:hypothetical protein